MKASTKVSKLTQQLTLDKPLDQVNFATKKKIFEQNFSKDWPKKHLYGGETLHYHFILLSLHSAAYHHSITMK